jgi:hypothetical protein
MLRKIIILFCVYPAFVLNTALAQTLKMQQGLLLKSGSDIRLGSVSVINERNKARAMSNTAGVFTIQALPEIR